MDPLDLLAEFVRVPGPPGQEEQIRGAVAAHVERLGFPTETDAKGNLLVAIGSPSPKLLVTAHLDEIAMIVKEVAQDGKLLVGPLGGLFPWKLGEIPVDILAPAASVQGILSFGSIHTLDKRNPARAATVNPLEWDMTRVLTGRSYEDLQRLGVKPGTRVVISKESRNLIRLGDLVASHFLDDRADLVSMVLALESLKEFKGEVMFAATASEEVGGEGALYLMQKFRPDVCIALELGPNVEDAPVLLNDEPTVWVTDSYSTMSTADLELVSEVGRALNMSLQFQALSRGGSDASCAASHGLCARPITLGLPMANSHGFEVIHPGSMRQLARLTESLVRKLA